MATHRKRARGTLILLLFSLNVGAAHARTVVRCDDLKFEPELVRRDGACSFLGRVGASARLELRDKAITYELWSVDDTRLAIEGNELKFLSAGRGMVTLGKDGDLFRLIEIIVAEPDEDPAIRIELQTGSMPAAEPSSDKPSYVLSAGTPVQLRVVAHLASGQTMDVTDDNETTFELMTPGDVTIDKEFMLIVNPHVDPGALPVVMVAVMVQHGTLGTVGTFAVKYE